MKLEGNVLPARKYRIEGSIATDGEVDLDIVLIIN